MMLTKCYVASINLIYNNVKTEYPNPKLNALNPIFFITILNYLLGMMMTSPILC